MNRIQALSMLSVVGAMVLLLWIGQAPTLSAPPVKITARILYAGNVGTARQKEFVDFLSLYFTEVGTTDITRLQAREADDYDVLLIDAEAKQGGSSSLDVPNLTLPETFSKPTVTIGVMGGLFSNRRHLKTGYL